MNIAKREIQLELFKRLVRAQLLLVELQALQTVSYSLRLISTRKCLLDTLGSAY